jgi:hypothetical protein
MKSGAPAAWFAVVVAVVAAPTVASPALANGGPRLSAYDYRLKSLGESDFGEGDYRWRWGVTICTSRAARVQVRTIYVDGDNPGAGAIVGFAVAEQRAGCKRHRLYSSGPNFVNLRSRLRLAWHGLHVKSPWRTATCDGCS